MKWASLAVGLAILVFGVQRFYLEPQQAAKAAAENPPPPPAPPPIEAPPPPVVDEEALEKIRLATKDSNPSVRWEGIQFMVDAGVPDADKYLMEMLQRDTEPEMRLRALGVLKGRRGASVPKALARALKDSEPEVRLAALEALGEREDTGAAASVSELVGDSDERVRLTAIRTLNTLNERRQQQAREAAERNARAREEYQEKVRQYEESQRRAAEKR